jgi:hypothetical protein
MNGDVTSPQRGDVISADFLARLAELASKADDTAARGNSGGISTTSFSRSAPNAQVDQLFVKMIRDAYELTDPNFSDPTLNPPDEENAVVLEFDDGIGDWVDLGGRRANVIPFEGIIPKSGDELWVRWNETIGGWVPVNDPSPPSRPSGIASANGQTGPALELQCYDGSIEVQAPSSRWPWNTAGPWPGSIAPFWWPPQNKLLDFRVVVGTVNHSIGAGIPCFIMYPCWNSSINYKVGDLVWCGHMQSCITDNINQDPVLAGEGWQIAYGMLAAPLSDSTYVTDTTWSSSYTYALGECCQKSGYVYQSTIPANLNYDPDTYWDHPDGITLYWRRVRYPLVFSTAGIGPAMLAGSGVPSSGIGNVGQYYVDVATGNVYLKS